MVNDVISIDKNALWDSNQNKITISIITPVYNRKKVLKRTLDSVMQQTLANIEHIIIDDGSTDNPDDIIFGYMSAARYPVMFIRKENGGVHTARNRGTEYARGKFRLLLDSDDEMTDQACELLINAWNSIPASVRKDYWEIVSLCRDDTGKVFGNRFPNNINILPRRKASIARDKAGSEHFCLQRMDIVNDNYFPEPDGVTFLTEDLIWDRLKKNYRSYFINAVTRIYHRDTENSLMKIFGGKVDKQHVKNNLWSETYFINRRSDYEYDLKEWINHLIRRNMYCNVLDGDSFLEREDIGVKRMSDRIILLLLRPPGILAGYIYKRKKLGI